MGVKGDQWDAGTMLLALLLVAAIIAVVTLWDVVEAWIERRRDR
jgi:hypothetical protein